MSSQFQKTASITAFFIIAISLRYYTNVVNPSFLVELNPYLQALLQGIGPLVGGLILVKFFKRPNFLKIFSLGFAKTVAIVLIPIILFTLVGFTEGLSSIAIAKIVGTFMLYAAFEEYGWRGYLQSELSGMRNIYKYLLITVLWFVWHLNLELSVGNLIFFLALFVGSYGIGFVADRSKSLVMAALFHSFFNISQASELAEIPLSYKLAIIAISAVSAIFIMRYNNPKEVIETVV